MKLTIFHKNLKFNKIKITINQFFVKELNFTFFIPIDFSDKFNYKICLEFLLNKLLKHFNNIKTIDLISKNKYLFTKRKNNFTISNYKITFSNMVIKDKYFFDFKNLSTLDKDKNLEEIEKIYFKLLDYYFLSKKKNNNYNIYLKLGIELFLEKAFGCKNIHNKELKLLALLDQFYLDNYLNMEFITCKNIADIGFYHSTIISNDYFKVRFLVDKKITYYAYGKTAKAQKDINLAEKICRKLNFKLELSHVLKNKAEMVCNSKFKNAEKYYLEASKILKEYPKQNKKRIKLEANLYFYYTFYLCRNLQHKKAYLLIEEFNNIFVKHDVFSNYIYNFMLFKYYFSIKNNKKALISCEKGYACLKSGKIINPTFELELVQIYIINKEFRKANDLLYELSFLAENNYNSYLKAIYNSNYGNLMRKKNKPQKSIFYYEQTLDYYKKTKSDYEIMIVNIIIATQYEKLEHPRKALKIYKEALKINVILKSNAYHEFLLEKVSKKE